MPDIARLTAAMPALRGVIETRWREACACNEAGCHRAAVILLGSVLEGLLLSRALLAKKGPSDLSEKEGGKAPSGADWTLRALSETAIAHNWLRRSMRGGSDDLRDYRNAIHPWEEASNTIVFDAITFRSRRKILRVIADDLVKSVENAPQPARAGAKKITNAPPASLRAARES